MVFKLIFTALEPGSDLEQAVSPEDSGYVSLVSALPTWPVA